MKRTKINLFLALAVMGLAGVLIGYIIGSSIALDFCVNTGLKVLSLDGVNLDFSDSMKAILKYYSGEWS